MELEADGGIRVRMTFGMPATKTKEPRIALRLLGAGIVAAPLAVFVQPLAQAWGQASEWSLSVAGGCIFLCGIVVWTRLKCWWKADPMLVLGFLGLGIVVKYGGGSVWYAIPVSAVACAALCFLFRFSKRTAEKRERA